jgi:hypothetical protein
MVWFGDKHIDATAKGQLGRETEEWPRRACDMGDTAIRAHHEGDTGGRAHKFGEGLDRRGVERGDRVHRCSG